MNFQDIAYERADGVATITLNRPQQMNAFTFRMLDEWRVAIDDARQDEGVNVVILTGAGRGFCAGADLRGGEAQFATDELETAASRRNFLRDGAHALTRAVQLLDKPYIAAVNGPAVGAGMDLASMCDVRFASESARFAMSYINHGLVPGDGGAYFLPRIVGLSKAFELMWSGDFMNAEAALASGYVSRVFPAGRLVSATHEFAARVADQSPVAIQLSKRLAYRAQDTNLDRALEDADWAMAMARTTEFAREAVRAFREKRDPASRRG